MKPTLSVLCMMLAAPAWLAAAEWLTPERYFECQIVVQKATIVGLKESGALVSRNGTRAEINAAAERARKNVAAAGAHCGASPGALAAYAYRQSAQVQAWLAEHPEIQAQLDDLSLQIQALSGASGQQGAGEPE